jgi:hypothetical protein
MNVVTNINSNAIVTLVDRSVWQHVLDNGLISPDYWLPLHPTDSINMNTSEVDHTEYSFHFLLLLSLDSVLLSHRHSTLYSLLCGGLLHLAVPHATSEAIELLSMIISFFSHVVGLDKYCFVK